MKQPTVESINTAERRSLHFFKGDGNDKSVILKSCISQGITIRRCSFRLTRQYILSCIPC